MSWVCGQGRGISTGYNNEEIAANGARGERLTRVYIIFSFKTFLPCSLRFVVTRMPLLLR